MAFLGAVGHLANLTQVLELGQGHAHQKESVRWTQRSYRLDVQALKIDLLGAARDDVRGTYDTHVGRLDTLLLLNGLLLPFALNTLQYSDEFVLQTREQCGEDCLEVRRPWMATVWAYLVGTSLILPFWSLLLLLWCKFKLDQWLQFTLKELQKLRRDIIGMPPSMEVDGGPSKTGSKDALFEHEEIVACLGSFIVDYQDFFSEIWSSQCAPLVSLATKLLWISITLSVALVGFMFWLFLYNRNGHQHSAHIHFLGILGVGLLVPALAYVGGQVLKRTASPGDIRRRFAPRQHACPQAMDAEPAPNTNSARTGFLQSRDSTSVITSHGSRASSPSVVTPSRSPRRTFSRELSTDTVR